MANLVTKFRYYKSKSKSFRGRYLKYIATRDGVEMLGKDSHREPSTKKQRELIETILKDYPDSAEMLEFEDYVNNPTIINASEFISRALEDNVNIFTADKTYADYIATRPRVEKIGSHGLFSQSDDEISLEKVSAEISSHGGNVWTMIVSLRREDAERLDFNNARRWRDMIRSKRDELAKDLKIPANDLKWYGAFHNESHHPHIHVLFYSESENHGYLTKKGIYSIRSSLAKSIFKDDLDHIYKKQTEIRDELKKDWKELLREILDKISNGTYNNPEIQQKLIELSIILANTKGKKVYGYLNKNAKDLIDSIVDLMAEDENIAKLYDMWYEEKYKILRTYSSNVPPKVPLSENKEFKSIKNDIIREALRIMMSEGGDLKIKPPPSNKNYSSYNHQRQQYYTSKKRIAATSVTRLFKNLGNIFSDNLGGDDAKKLPVIDRRQHKEIEDKKNAELTIT